eukprot:m.56671 g.56671  ORF g.56671 m.56671 type:complete len:385 (-) comp22278_c1_seq1:64-1218(-)
MFTNTLKSTWSGFGSNVSCRGNHSYIMTQLRSIQRLCTLNPSLDCVPTHIMVANPHPTHRRHSVPFHAQVLHYSSKAVPTVKEVLGPKQRANPFSQERLQRLTSSKVRRDQELLETKLYPLTTLLSFRNMCSMKEAIVYIRGGHVLLDGIPEKLNVKVPAIANVRLSPAAHKLQQDKINIVQFKPFSFVSQTQSKKCRSRPAKELLTWENRIKPPRKVATFTELTRKLPPKHYHELGLGGRLDADSSGLLIWTANGVVSKLATSSSVSKEYEVVVERRKTSINREKVVQLFANGFVLDNDTLLPVEGTSVLQVEAKWMNDKVLRLVLREGKFRQIRRMLDKVGYNVTRLTRTRYGKLRLEDLQLRPGEWATFNANELLDYPSNE